MEDDPSIIDEAGDHIADLGGCSCNFDKQKMTADLVDRYNACAGINPEAVPKMLEALESLLSAAKNTKIFSLYPDKLKAAESALALAGKESE